MSGIDKLHELPEAKEIQSILDSLPGWAHLYAESHGDQWLEDLPPEAI
jgi:hypothetical protein